MDIRLLGPGSSLLGRALVERTELADEQTVSLGPTLDQRGADAVRHNER